jgi:hypothetical protein
MCCWDYIVINNRPWPLIYPSIPHLPRTEVRRRNLLRSQCGFPSPIPDLLLSPHLNLLCADLPDHRSRCGFPSPIPDLLPSQPPVRRPARCVFPNPRSTPLSPSTSYAHACPIYSSLVVLLVPRTVDAACSKNCRHSRMWCDGCMDLKGDVHKNYIQQCSLWRYFPTRLSADVVFVSNWFASFLNP